ncbi:transporter substrate-binding domain-containing protein [Duganella sp. FT92W]|uniref:Transporter substrate-binding domain-containing protein n=2 Tax=Pseudoduganella rivuli TaxID=2666085 RepID=A0A7X2IMW9_9BURK|nr:transporter substrate-binding domain-containing protein [Pseudoduganella rivuli]
MKSTLDAVMKKSCLLLALSALLAAGAHAQDSGTLRKIKETGVISIGFRDKSIPFSYLDRQQRPIGYSIELCERVVAAVKNRLKLPTLEVMYRPVTAANRMAFVANDIVDIECGSTSNTLERQKEVAFSVTTFVSSSSLMSRKANSFQSLAELKGRTVVSTAGTTTVKALQEWSRALDLDLRIIAAKDHADAFAMVESDRAAAFAMDEILLLGLAATAAKPGDYAVHRSDLPQEPYGMVLRKRDPEFKRVVDDAIIELYRSGEIHQIYRKWFQSPLPNSRIELHMPMSAALRRVVAAPTDSGDPADYR